MTLAILLRLNALSCLLFGALFLSRSVPVAAALGDPPPGLVRLVGLVLVLHAAHLAWASTRRPRAWEVRYFSIGDALWVAATLALVLAGLWITTALGQVLALAVAAGVGCLGWMQWRAVAPRRP